ncbi:MAG: phosphoribosylformylglycinamidine synthase subunit PurQ [Armatimonadetes bacterium]|nr:phosphoribosylformylglycinamidine synthase subunit PurQ [Armatimonadota bacterium]
MKRIALTVSYDAPPTNEKNLRSLQNYFAAVHNAGASIEALFLDEWSHRAHRAARDFDGVVLAGGADLPPSWYGEAPIEGAGLDFIPERRPKFENEVVAAFLEHKKPVLGICYGCQFLNVFRGGALIQDIECQLPQRENPVVHVDGNPHLVRLNRESQLYKIIGEEEFPAPSYHHQATSRPAPDAQICATAPDGVIEAVEWKLDHFFVGVQWHPERAPDSNATRRLMEAFVKSA